MKLSSELVLSILCSIAWSCVGIGGAMGINQSEHHNTDRTHRTQTDLLARRTGVCESAIELKGPLMGGLIPRESSVDVRTLKLHRRPGREYFSAVAPLPGRTSLRSLPCRIGPSLLERCIVSDL